MIKDKNWIIVLVTIIIIAISIFAGLYYNSINSIASAIEAPEIPAISIEVPRMGITRFNPKMLEMNKPIADEITFCQQYLRSIATIIDK